MKRRFSKSFLLTEVLVAGFLVACILIPLLSLPLKAFRAELNELRKIDLMRETKVALLDAIEQLPKEIDWGIEKKTFNLPDKGGFSRTIHYSVAPNQRKERKKVFKQISLDIELSSLRHKKLTKKRQFTVLIHKEEKNAS